MATLRSPSKPSTCEPPPAPGAPVAAGPAPELRDRLLAPCAERDSQGNVVGVNAGALVRRLLLFEQYVLESAGLRELPLLVDVLGFDGVMRLLESGTLRVTVDEWRVAQVGQSDVVKPSSGTRAALPLGHFAFSTVAFFPEGSFDPSTPPSKLDPFALARQARFDEIRALDTLGKRSNQALRRAIADALLSRSPGPVGEDVFDNLARDLRGHPVLLQVATAQALTKVIGRDVDPSSLSLNLEQVYDREFRVETNIERDYGLSVDVAHKVVEQGLLGVASVNHRLDDMRTFRALSGFQADELPIFVEKVRALPQASDLDPERQVRRLDRVIELSGLPDISYGAAGRIDVRKLLTVRDSEECREFRQWLRTVDDVTDAEIAERANSLGERVASVVHSGIGRRVRFLVAAGIGVRVRDPVVGIGLGALDEFVVETVVPKPGPISFISKSYRSIFKG